MAFPLVKSRSSSTFCVKNHVKYSEKPEKLKKLENMRFARVCLHLARFLVYSYVIEPNSS